MQDHVHSHSNRDRNTLLRLANKADCNMPKQARHQLGFSRIVKALIGRSTDPMISDRRCLDQRKRSRSSTSCTNHCALALAACCGPAQSASGGHPFCPALCQIGSGRRNTESQFQWREVGAFGDQTPLTVQIREHACLGFATKPAIHRSCAPQQ